MFCEDCINWQYRYGEYNEVYGSCNELMVNMKLKKESMASTEEEAVFTHKRFGCIYFKKNHLVVANLNFLNDPLL